MRRHRSLLFKVLVLASSVSCHRSAFGDEKSQMLESVLSDMRRGRNELRTGVCNITGKYKSTKSEAEEPTFDGDLRIFVAFDGDHKMRFDRTQPHWVPDASTARERPGKPGEA